MQQRPSWEANLFAASQIPRILCNPKFHYRIHKSVRHLSLSSASSTQSIPPYPTSWRSILILSSPLCLVSPVASFPQVSPPKSIKRLFPPPYALPALPFVFFSILSSAVKGKAVPLQARSGPKGSRKLRFPDFVTSAQKGGKVVSLTHRPHLPPGNPGTHFC